MRSHSKVEEILEHRGETLCARILSFFAVRSQSLRRGGESGDVRLTCSEKRKSSLPRRPKTREEKKEEIVGKRARTDERTKKKEVERFSAAARERSRREGGRA